MRPASAGVRLAAVEELDQPMNAQVSAKLMMASEEDS